MSHNFENLEIYKRGMELAKEVLLTFSELRPYRFSEQICAAATSIPSNISEGAERGTDKEFRRFLEFASGSAAELYTQLNLAKDANFISTEKADILIKSTKELRAMIRGLMGRFS